MGSRKNIVVEVGSIFIFALGLFVLVSILTFHIMDPSLYTNTSGDAANACGRVGSYLAAFLVHSFGMGSYLVPVILFMMASTIHKRGGYIEVMGTLAGMVVAVSSLTVILALHQRMIAYGGGSVLSGGIFGSWMAHVMAHQLNVFGASLVAGVVFLLSITISTPVHVADFSAKGIRFVLQVGLRMAVLFSKMAGRMLRGGLSKIYVRFQEWKEGVKVRWNSIKTKAPNLLPISEPISKNNEVQAAENEPEDEIEEAPEDKIEELKILPRAADSVPKASEKHLRAPVQSHRGQWKLPTVEFLKNPPRVESSVNRERLISNSHILKQKFADFGIAGEVTAVRPGPVITLYEFKPGPGVKVSRIAALADDLSMALSAQSVRILAPLPGKSVVGIEIPSDNREMVYLREFLQHPDFYGIKHMIPVVMGKDIGGQTYLSDLGRMPHLLCAGQTGSGKSVFMNGLICSLFYRFTPDDLRMILVDPKFIEFRAYQDIPHLLLPVVDDPKQANLALKWAVREMDRRYRILAKIGARNLASFNQKVEEMGAEVIRDLLCTEEEENSSSSVAHAGAANSASTSDWIEAFDPDEAGAPKVGKLPYIVIIIDELADLMMIAKKEVEISIARIAQKARAAGIHLVIATQRPSTDVITGLIKANLPSRVSFQLASYVDSKTILDRAGAERLLGQGDMLFIPPGVSQTMRLHGAFLSDDEINKITGFLKAQGKPVYRDEILIADEDDEDALGGDGSQEDDALMKEGIELVKQSGHASASFLQRHLKIGYNRAARMIETMEARGIVGAPDGAKPREVLIR